MPVSTHQIIFCEEAYQSEDGKAALAGVHSGLALNAFPVVLPRLVLFTSFQHWEPDIQLMLAINFPDGTEMIKMQVRSGNFRPGKDNGHQVVIRCGSFLVKEPGPYRCRLYRADSDVTLAERNYWVRKIDEAELAAMMGAAQ